MRLANLFFALSMAVYFTIGSHASIIWGDFYYTALFAFVCCLIIVKCKRWVDEIVGVSLVGSIWLLYLVRPIVFDTFFYEWMRFSLGILIFIFTAIYTIYICYDRHRKPNT